MVKVGIVVPQYGVGIRETDRFIRTAEKLGYYSLWVEDHLMPWQLQHSKPAFECFTLLTHVASITKKPRIGTLVTNVIYRHPAILAKSATTIDRISNGRLELGLGLGWYEDEILSYNLPYPPLKQRIEMLSELIDYLKKLWTSKGKVSFNGKYFKLKKAYFNPKPKQKPHPPIIIGTGGEKKMLKLVAEKANGWNYGALAPEQFKEKAAILRKHCENIGRDFSEIEKSLELYVFIAETPEEAENIKRKYWETIPKGEKLQHIIQDLYMKTALTGTPRDVEEAVREYAKAGVDHLVLVFPGKRRFEMMKMFGEKVLPNL
ncbi:MAG: LLM class F420-dependent oxidoreductase [Desulfurococcales archaeon ex4484_217_2]|nr:MAG: LLM class F420-dependent oxidoreductase [Desulfurococcales archaeon ex4484_217_2]